MLHLQQCNKCYSCCWLDAHVQHKDIDKRFEPLLDKSNNLNNNKIKDIVNSKSWIYFFDKITNSDVLNYVRKNVLLKKKFYRKEVLRKWEVIRDLILKRLINTKGGLKKK